MTEPDDLTRRLDALGATSPPPPTDDFLADLEAARLGRAPERPARVFRLPVVLPAAAVAAVVLGFVLLAFGGGGSSEPRTVTIVTASDASVLQAEQAVPAEQGLTLRDGDRVTTGPTGSVTVGDVTIGPNEEAVVRGGRLRRLRRYLQRQATTTTTSTTVAPTPATPTTAPTASTVPPPTTSSTAPPPTNVTATRRNLPVSLELVGRRLRNGNVGFAWSTYEGADFAGYVVLREDRDVVARRPSVDGTEAVDRAAPSGPTRYVVVVLDADRKPVARSNVVRL